MDFVLVSLLLSILVNILQTLVFFLRFLKAVREQPCKKCQERDYVDLNIQEQHDPSLMF